MENSRLELPRCAPDDPERLNQLKDAFRTNVVFLLAEAIDAGYSQGEAFISLLDIVQNMSEDPDPADNLRPPKDVATREDIVAKSALDM